MKAVLDGLAVLAFFAGIAGLVKPRLIKLPSRWAAGALTGFSLVIIALSIELYPPSEAEKSSALFFPMLISWALLCGIIWTLRRYLRQQKAEGAAATPFRSSGPDDEAGGAAQHAIRGPYLREVVSGGDSPAGSSPRMIGRMHEDYYSGEEEGEWGAILRRGMDGRPLQFEYADRYGEVTSRLVFNWVEYPRHVQGWCDLQSDIRCFRKDRVIEWMAGSDEQLRAPKGKSRR